MTTSVLRLRTASIATGMMVDVAAASERAAGTSMPDYLGADYLLQLTGGLLVVLLGVLALAWLMRRVTHSQSAAAGHLQALGGLSLGARERVVLIRAGDAHVLVGVAPGCVRALHVLEGPLPAGATERAGASQESFATRLATLMAKGPASR